MIVTQHQKSFKRHETKAEYDVDFRGGNESKSVKL